MGGLDHWIASRTRRTYTFWNIILIIDENQDVIEDLEDRREIEDLEYKEDT